MSSRLFRFGVLYFFQLRKMINIIRDTAKHHRSYGASNVLARLSPLSQSTNRHRKLISAHVLEQRSRIVCNQNIYIYISICGGGVTSERARPRCRLLARLQTGIETVNSLFQFYICLLLSHRHERHTNRLKTSIRSLILLARSPLFLLLFTPQKRVPFASYLINGISKNVWANDIWLNANCARFSFIDALTAYFSICSDFSISFYGPFGNRTDNRIIFQLVFCSESLKKKNSKFRNGTQQLLFVRVFFCFCFCSFMRRDEEIKKSPMNAFFALHCDRK